MKKKMLKHSRTVSSLGYSVFEVAQGLFFHPYQTVQFLVKKNTFKFLIFFPAFSFLFTKLIFIFLGNLELFSSLKIFKTFMWYWFKYFFYLWQGVIFYLFFRFWYAWKNKND
jgi:hypothetical protein